MGYNLPNKKEQERGSHRSVYQRSREGESSSQGIEGKLISCMTEQPVQSVQERNITERFGVISPKAYFKTMFSILYCAITKPFSTTYIDFSTGKIVGSNN